MELEVVITAKINQEKSHKIYFRKILKSKVCEMKSQNMLKSEDI